MIILTADEMMAKGLELGGCDRRRQQRACRATNLHHFKSFYGALPSVYAEIFSDLQTTEIDEARVDPRKICPESFLQAINWLKCYPTEDVRSGGFGGSNKTTRKWGWHYAKKIQALKHEKVSVRITLCTFFEHDHVSLCISISLIFDLQIVWPENWTEDNLDDTTPIFLVSVDGVHCRVQEPIHPTLAKDPSWYSHKFNQPGVTYELGVSTCENRLVWINGPHKASKHDGTIYKEGLRQKIPPGRRVVADKAHRGSKKSVSAPGNSNDGEELRLFKGRARARHESFNSRLKEFNCMSMVFRHKVKKHKICFEAVCVILQHQMEHGSVLFDV